MCASACLQVVFKPIPEVWGYFSVKGGGGIHEFSDSQVRPLLADLDTDSAKLLLLLSTICCAAQVPCRLCSGVGETP